MRVRVQAGTPIHECGLCGARFGERLAVEALDDAEVARQRCVPELVWPLVRALERLPGLHVREASAGDEASRTLPFVELGLVDADALVQIENVAKSLLVAAGGLKCHWVVEVEYRRHLAFVLKPRHGGGAIATEQVRDARIDLSMLWRNFERDSRLGWWRHAGGDPTG
jgi:hypothetical protein